MSSETSHSQAQTQAHRYFDQIWRLRIKWIHRTSHLILFFSFHFVFLSSRLRSEAWVSLVKLITYSYLVCFYVPVYDWQPALPGSLKSRFTYSAAHKDFSFRCCIFIEDSIHHFATIFKSIFLLFFLAVLRVRCVYCDTMTGVTSRTFSHMIDPQPHRSDKVLIDQLFPCHCLYIIYQITHTSDQSNSHLQGSATWKKRS